MVQNGELHFDADLVRRELDRVLSSRVFFAAKRSRMFLCYIVERSLLGCAPKEFEIAAEVLGRGANYDPDIDATVRVEASRLRNRLREYYDTEGKGDPVSISIPKGGYGAVFVSREASQGVSTRVTESCTAPWWLTAADTSFASPQTNGSPARKPDSAEAQLQAGDVPRSTWLLNHRKFRRWWIGTVVMVAALAGTVVWIHPWAARSRQQAAGPIHSLAVLPLQNLSGNVQEEYFVDGMTDALITELARTPNLRVVSRTSAMQEKGNKKRLRQIASELDVDAVIEGSVVRSGDRVRITAQLIDARDDRHVWAESYEEQMSDILTLQDKVVREIALHAQAALTPDHERVHSGRIHPAAYDAYLRGLYFLNQRNVAKSLTYFQQAVDLDSSYADAYAGLAEAIITIVVSSGKLDKQPQALAAAKRAIELDPESGEAHTALGYVEMNYTRDWTAAARELEKGIELSPSNSLAEMQYSIYLDIMARPEQAVTHMRRALQLDPRSFLMNRHLGAVLYLARHYSEALLYLQRAEEMEPSRFGYVASWMARCYEVTLHLDEAMRADLRDLSANVADVKLASLRQAYRRGGWKAYQRARIDLVSKQPSNGCDLYEVGESYIQLGDRDRAFLWLGRGTKAGCFWADMLSVDPVLDGIRGDPRFPALRRMAHLGDGSKAAVR